MAVIVVTGANSGIGRSTAVHLAAAGHTVHGAMRDLGKGAKHQELHPDSPYADAHRRMFAFYATGIEANVRPSEVAEVVQQAIEDDEYFERFEQAFGLDIRAGDFRTDEQRAAGL